MAASGLQRELLDDSAATDSLLMVIGGPQLGNSQATLSTG
jgi:hypothetical protein